MRSWVGDIIVISDLAMRVHITYKDTPNCYKHISEEVAVLRTLIEKVAQHFKRSAISKNDCHEGQKVLEGCQSVLKDLYSLMEKYKSRASTHKGLPFLGAKFGEDNIVTLRERLVFNTGLLHGFNRRFVIFRSANPIDINISILDANILRSKQSWLLFLVSTTQDQEFQQQLLPPLQQIQIDKRPTRGFAKT